MTTTTTPTKPRKPGTMALVVGVITVPVGLLLFVILAGLASAVPAVGDNPLLLLLVLLLVLGGVVSLIVGVVRRLLAR